MDEICKIPSMECAYGDCSECQHNKYEQILFDDELISVPEDEIIKYRSLETKKWDKKIGKKGSNKNEIYPEVQWKDIKSKYIVYEVINNNGTLEKNVYFYVSGEQSKGSNSELVFLYLYREIWACS